MTRLKFTQKNRLKLTTDQLNNLRRLLYNRGYNCQATMTIPNHLVTMRRLLIAGDVRLPIHSYET